MMMTINDDKTAFIFWLHSVKQGRNDSPVFATSQSDRDNGKVRIKEVPCPTLLST
jgi:hypothetical protein